MIDEAEALERAIRLVRDPATPVEIRLRLAVAILDLAEKEDPGYVQKLARKPAMQHGAELVELLQSLTPPGGEP